MEKKPQLIDVIDYQSDIAPYKFIKIFSGVGSGKTQLACNMIRGNAKYHIPPQTVLLITSRRSTVEETLKQMKNAAVGRAEAFGNLSEEVRWDNPDEYERYVRIIKEEYSELLTSESEVYNKSVVCTNAHIEQYFKNEYEPSVRSTHLWELFDTIIVDEVHSLITDATYQSAPFYVLELINEFLRRCAAHDIQNEEKKRLILMTGTPAPLDLLEIVPFDSEKSATYDFFDTCVNVQPSMVTVVDKKSAFAELHKILKDNGKAVWFTNHVATKQNVYENWHINQSVRVEVSFSSKDAKKVVGEKAVSQMDELNSFIAQNRRLPDDVRLFVSTSRNKEGINIENKDIRYMFVESHFSDDIIQMAGRIRVGVEKLYIIADAEQLSEGVDVIEAEFATKYISPLQDEFSRENCGAANEHLLKICGEGKFSDIPFNTKARHQAKDVAGEYIRYIHNTFPYVRYSYVLNRFVFYKQREDAEAYTFEQCKAFSNAVVKSKRELEKLIKGWFPNALISPLLTIDERCKQHIESVIFVNKKHTREKLTTEQVVELRKVLGEIRGKPIVHLNPVLEKLGYSISKRDRLGYYWFHKGTTPQKRSPSKKSKK